MLTRHPANIILRVFLEIVGLISIAQWGWNQADGWLKYLLAAGIPLVMVLVWMLIASPEDPGRDNQAVIAVSGKVRLAIEICFFALAVLAMIANDQVYLAGAYVFVLLLQSFWSAERIIWLSRN
jgi:hypothetical protein